jgi:hypothetical protein
VTHVNTPTYYTTALPSSSSMMVARPLETITLVPAKLTGQTFVVSSAPPLKLAPIQKTIIQPPQTQNVSFSQHEESLDPMSDVSPYFYVNKRILRDEY